ncbi:MAG: PIN domain-containing protein [Burkholderiales bacterium]
MAGSARYTALLDANVLFPALLRDVLLSLALADLYSAKWSADIRRELEASLLRNFPDMNEKVSNLADCMEEAIPDCLVTGYEGLIDGMNLPDPDDRHVLAAAIVGHADAIVTFNQKDFPQDLMESLGIELQTPDEFIVNQLMLKGTVALAAIKAMRARWERPALSSEEFVDLLERRDLPQTAAHLRDQVTLI